MQRSPEKQGIPQARLPRRGLIPRPVFLPLIAECARRESSRLAAIHENKVRMRLPPARKAI
jgi:hypothetical protein